MQQDIHEITGSYEKNKPYAGSLGGQVTLLAIAIQALENVDLEYSTHESKQASIEGGSKAHSTQPKKHLRDLLDGPGFYLLLLNYIKDMKNDNFILMINHRAQALLEEFKINNAQEIYRLSEEQI